MDSMLREEILNYYYCGYSVRECSERYDITEKDVRYIIKRDEED
jgi:transposase